MKTCNKCVLEKQDSDFSKCYGNDGTEYRVNTCKQCRKPGLQANQVRFHENNPERKKEYSQRNYLLNRNVKLQKSRDHYYATSGAQKERGKRYRENNKELIKEKRKLKARELRVIDPVFKLKNNVSRAIRHAFKKNAYVKDGACSKYLDYSMEELKINIESKFEPWMNWCNYGKYNSKNWNDNDPNTWSWQLDHIIPQCVLTYSSMSDENFKKCWALDNLRPLSSKENYLLGIKAWQHKISNRKKAA